MTSLVAIKWFQGRVGYCLVTSTSTTTFPLTVQFKGCSGQSLDPRLPTGITEPENTLLYCPSLFMSSGKSSGPKYAVPGSQSSDPSVLFVQQADRTVRGAVTVETIE